MLHESSLCIPNQAFFYDSDHTLAHGLHCEGPTLLTLRKCLYFYLLICCLLVFCMDHKVNRSLTYSALVSRKTCPSIYTNIDHLYVPVPLEHFKPSVPLWTSFAGPICVSHPPPIFVFCRVTSRLRPGLSCRPGLPVLESCVVFINAGRRGDDHYQPSLRGASWSRTPYY